MLETGLVVYFVCLFGVLRRFQHCTGHITTGSWKGRGNQYIECARVVYCKLPTYGKQLPAFPLEPVWGSNPGLRGQVWWDMTLTKQSSRYWQILILFYNAISLISFTTTLNSMGAVERPSVLLSIGRI